MGYAGRQLTNGFHFLSEHQLPLQLLALFHFLLENRLARGIGLGRRDISDEAITDVHAKLKIIPRLGLGVITATYVLMMFAVRGV